jgi:hypothetical protein
MRSKRTLTTPRIAKNTHQKINPDESLDLELKSDWLDCKSSSSFCKCTCAAKQLYRINRRSRHTFSKFFMIVDYIL